MAMIVDNGLEFHSDSIVTACSSLGIVIQYRTPQTPCQKGKIESLFRALNKETGYGNPGSAFGKAYLNGGASWE